MFNRAVSRLSRKRPPSDIHDSDGSSSSSHQSLKTTAKWATSLESLLEDPEGVKRFREFLKKEFSEENVLFWLACEDFKKLQDKKQMQEKAKEIYVTFLSNKASSQVNVEGQSRLNEKILEEPHPLMFQKLQDQLADRRGCQHTDLHLSSHGHLPVCLSVSFSEEDTSPWMGTHPKCNAALSWHPLPALFPNKVTF
nr:regulator of G-protein signaling 10 isoform X1 [Marmota flaviventris]